MLSPDWGFVSTKGLIHFFFPDIFLLELREKVIALHEVINVDDFPVSKVYSVSINILVVGVVDQSHLRRGLELTLKDRYMVSGIVLAIKLISSSELANVFEIDGYSKKHTHGQIIHLFSELKGYVSHILL